MTFFFSFSVKKNFMQSCANCSFLSADPYCVLSSYLKNRNKSFINPAYAPNSIDIWSFGLHRIYIIFPS